MFNIKRKYKKITTVINNYKRILEFNIFLHSIVAKNVFGTFYILFGKIRFLLTILKQTNTYNNLQINTYQVCWTLQKTTVTNFNFQEEESLNDYTEASDNPQKDDDTEWTITIDWKTNRYLVLSIGFWCTSLCYNRNKI